MKRQHHLTKGIPNMQTIMKAMIMIQFIFWICVISAIGFFVYKVNTIGLKPLIEEIWAGPSGK